MNFLLQYIWYFLAVAFVLVFLLILRKRRTKLSLPVTEEISKAERALLESRHTLRKLRTALIEIKDNKLDYYVSIFIDPLNELTSKILNAIDIAMRLERDDIICILKICNHRIFILTAKRCLKKTGEAIEDEFIGIQQRMNLELPIHSHIENIEMIIYPFMPLLKKYEKVLDKFPTIEMRLMNSTEEFKKVAKPGFFRKVGYFFSDNLEKKDRVRLRAITKDWGRLQAFWGEVANLNNEMSVEFRTILNDYLTKLFVFTPCETLEKQIISSENPVKPSILQDIEESA